MTVYIFQNSNIIPYLISLKDENIMDRGDLFLFSYYSLLLEKKGLFLGEPYIKEIRKSLRELRPGNQRYFFTIMQDDYYLLHYFRKRSRNTPPRELKKAVEKLEALEESSGGNFLPLEKVFSMILSEEDRKLIHHYTGFMAELLPEYKKDLLNFPRYFDKGHIDPPLLWILSLKEKNK